jgi:hypothetical protein
MTSTTDTRDTNQPEEDDPTRIPDWINVEALPGYNVEDNERRTQLGMQGMEIASQLAAWVREVYPLRVDARVEIDANAEPIWFAIDRAFGLTQIELVVKMLDDLPRLFESRSEDPEPLANFVERHGMYFLNGAGLYRMVLGRDTAERVIEAIGGTISYPWDEPDEEVGR